MNVQTVLMLDLGVTLRGGQRQVQYLARYLARHAAREDEEPLFAPVIACPAESALARAAREDGLQILPLPGRRVANPLIWVTLQQAVRRLKARIIHTHDAHAAAIGAGLRAMSPHLLLVHSRRVSYQPASSLRMWKYRIADAVVGVSREIADGMIAAGVPAAKVHTIHSGIAPETYEARRPHAAGAPFVFLSIGAMTPQKGFSVLLDAAARLAAQPDLPPWKVRIAGDGELMPALRRQCRELGLETLAELPGRREGRQELPLCDAVVVPSVDGEGSSAAIKEAWATGVPLLASDLASNQELVRDEYNGLLAKNGDAESLATGMRRLMTEPELARRLVAGGADTLPAFTDIRMAESYRLLYKSLLKP